MTPYQTLQTLLARRPMAMPELLAKTGMTRKTLHRLLNELIHEQKTIQRAARGVYAAVPAPTAAPVRTGRKAGMGRTRMLARAGAGRGPVGPLDGNHPSAAGCGTWPGKNHGIRRPEGDETRLSGSEARVALREGVL